MRTGSSGTSFLRNRGRSRLGMALKKARKSHQRFIDVEGLEARTLLATIPAVAPSEVNGTPVTPIPLTDYTDVTTQGDTSSPMVAVDPYDAQKVFAAWVYDGSQTAPGLPPDSVIQASYSSDGGTDWTSIGSYDFPWDFPGGSALTAVTPIIDPLTINNPQPVPYTQASYPSVAWDASGDVYLLSMQETNVSDGALVLTRYNFSGSAPTKVALPNNGIIYQFLPGSDSVTTPTLAVDSGTHPSSVTTLPADVPNDPYANDVYIAWSTTDVDPATPIIDFAPNMAELVVGTPVASGAPGEESLAFSGVHTINMTPNQGLQSDTHPQLVISTADPSNPGQITMSWEDAGTDATLAPPVTVLTSNIVDPGNSYGFSGSTGFIQPATTLTSTSTQGNWTTTQVLDAGPNANDAADPVSVALADVNTDGIPDIVVADESPLDSADSGIGVLINQGGGVFPAAGVTDVYSAGPDPSSVVLGQFVAGHTITTNPINDAAVANDSGQGGVTVMENGTPGVGDGMGAFQAATHLNTIPPDDETSMVVANYFDGSAKLSIVAASTSPNSISWFPDASSTASGTLDLPFTPMAIVAANFRGGVDPDLAVLYTNGDIKFLINTSTGTGNIGFTLGQMITSTTGTVAIATGVLANGLPDLVIANSNGNVDWLQNTSVIGGATISFNTTPKFIANINGTPVAIATGKLSQTGNPISAADIAVLYAAPSTNESMVAVYQNSGTGTFTYTPNPNGGGDFDAGATGPTGIAVAYLTNASAAPWEDIVVTSNGNNTTRGYVSILHPTALSSSTVTIPETTTYTDAVSGLTSSSINDITATIALTDNQSIANLRAVLQAPDGTEVTLFLNQITVVGSSTTTNTSVGLPTGNAVGVYGFSPSGGGGDVIGTVFDDNATRDIFDGTPAIPTTNGNAAAGSGYVGWFRPEGGAMSNFLGPNVNLNGTWKLFITNESAAGPPSGGDLEEFNLHFSGGLTQPYSPVQIASQFVYVYGSNTVGFVTDVVGGSLTDTYPTAAPSTLQGIGPGMVMAVDNTLGPYSPYGADDGGSSGRTFGRIYMAFVGWFDVEVNGVDNPTTNTDIFLVYSDDGGQTWSAPEIVNDDQGSTDGESGANDSLTPNANNIVTGRSQFQPEIAVDQSTGTLVMSWRDARDDAANARVATYITSSIDGGQTFAAQTYANPPEIAVDSITLATNDIGPASDDESAGNAQTDLLYGYGDQMGLAVSNGQVFPVWAGNFYDPNYEETNNFNDSYWNGTAVVAFPLNIWYQPMTIASGPRVVSSTMGPVQDTTLSGSAVDLPNFVPPVGTPTGSATTSVIPITGDPSLDVTSIEVTVNIVYADDGNLILTLIAPNGQSVILYQDPSATGQSFTSTTFSDSASEPIASGTGPYTGTFRPSNPLSVLNGQRAVGNWTLQITGGNANQAGLFNSWSISINGAASMPTAFEVTFDRPVDPQALIALNEETFTKSDVEVFYHDTTSGDASIPLLVTGVAPVVPPYYDTDPTQDGTDGYENFIVTFNPNELPSGAASDITNFTGTYSYVILPDNGASTPTPTTPTPISAPVWSYDTVQAPQTPLTGSATPDEPVDAYGPGGSGTGYDQTNSFITLTAPANDVIAGVTVTVNITDPTNGLGDLGDLELGLFSPNGTLVYLYYKPGDKNKNFTNVTFSDQGAESIEVANGPYTNGTYQGYNPMALLNGGPAAGTYQFAILNYSSINIGEFVSWSITVDTTAPKLEFQTGAAMDQDADAAGDLNPLTTPFIGLAPGDAYVVPTPQTSVPFTFNKTNILNPPFNQNTLPLIMPGPYVTSTSVPGGTGSDNLVLDGTNSSLDVTFNTPIQAASVTPGQVLSIMGPVGPIAGAQTSLTYPSDDTVQTINTASTFTGTLTNNSAVVTGLSSIAGLVVGQPITGTGIPASATIVSIDSSTEVTLSEPATASGFETLTALGYLPSTTTIPSFDGTFTIAHISVSLNIAFTDDADLTAILIAPDGTQVPLFAGVGGTGGNFVNTTFDDSGETSITTGKAPFTGTYRPTGQLSTLDGKTVDIKNPADPAEWIAGVWTLEIINNSTGTKGTLENWALNITAGITVAPVSPSSTINVMIPAATASGAGVLNSQLTIPANPSPGNVDSSLTVQVSLTDPNLAALSAVLIAPNGTQVDLFAAGTLSGSNLTNTVFSDSGASLISAGSAPYTGTFKPEDPAGLAKLIGENLAGTWTLQVTNTATGVAQTLKSWSLVTSSETYAALVATTFAISFPQQDLSGTYTIELGADPSTGLFPIDQYGNQVDTALEAGLTVLRGGSSSSPVKTVNYAATDLPKVIPAPPIGQTTGQVTSTIIVPDNFVVQGDTTSSGISGLRVTLSLTFPNDTALVLTLDHYDLNGDLLASIPLATDVGGTSTAANFSSTTFDDRASTPIEEGGAPFFGTFTPQEPLSDFAGLNAQGTWVLTVQNTSAAGKTGTLNSWSLSFQRPEPTSDLGVPGADNISASFRIFNLDQASAMSAEAWTPVGSASNNAGAGVTTADTMATSGKVTAIAVDPSDPTGNTVYAAAATGGIWKTTDFLTTNPGGPTWIALTDFGPSDGVNIGSITVFPQNNNVNQSIIIAATGDGNTTPTTPGVGFLISSNGGATWTLDDSSTNVDANGNPLPIETTTQSLERDRTFVGDTIYPVVVDPKLSATGVIISAAVSGPSGGIWRSLDSGAHWTNMLPGQATSVVLDQDSGAVINNANGTTSSGNLQIVYAGIKGLGVEMSPNQGEIWSLMTGGVGNPLIVNTLTDENVNPVAGLTPNGAEGNIVLSVPQATGLAAEDPIYEGWLYAAVATPGGGFFGLFETKDFGENWTEVSIPTVTQAIPTNNVASPNYQVTGQGEFSNTGNNVLTMALDPTNPNIVYLGGSSTYLDGQPTPPETGFIRVDTTNIWDAHSLVPYSSFSDDGGEIALNSTGPVTITTPVDTPPYYIDYIQGANIITPLENFIRSPQDPFLANATLDVFDYSTFTNNGAGVTWIPFDLGGTDNQTITTMVDPLTGLPRIIVGNAQGIWTALDNDGTFETQVGQSASGVQQGSPSDQLANVDRNGNLQITQFYYGAVQPSTAAAQIAGALFYGSSQDNGGPVSDPNIISDGNITYYQAVSDYTGNAVGVATDQQGLGSAYQYFMPCCGGNDTDFFQYIGPGLSGAGLANAGEVGDGYVGRTFGLFQASDGLPTPDPQWPYGQGTDFAVNPVDSAEVVISSNVGRIFDTTNAGVTWFDVGDPGDFGNPGSFSLALAYGAPDPAAPQGVGDLGNFIYVGTQTGQIYVTENGGGNGSSNNWINISAGLDGKPVVSIVTDPIRGSHDAYAITTDGVFYMPDSLASGATWANITNNLYNLSYSIFGQTYNPTQDGNAVTLPQAVTLSSIVADWRYQIPFDPSDLSKGSHPVLYVSSGGTGSTGSGVYQSLDNGATWTLFPSTTYGAVADGGDLPHDAVTDLDVSLGNVNANTGMPSLVGPDQAIVFSGTLTSGSDSVTGVGLVGSLAPGDTVTGDGIPTGTTIVSVNTFGQSIILTSDATATGSATLAAADPTVTPDPDLLLATTWGRGQFAIDLPPLIVGNSVEISPTAPGVASNPVYVGTPITISGTSEITGFGNTTWITVEDVTNPADPIVVAGYNPNDPIPVPSSDPNTGNSTDSTGSFTFNWNPATLYGMDDGVKTLEIFATDDSGAVGNKVTVQFNWDPATQLQFAGNFASNPPASVTAEPGANFATPLPVIVDADDKFGNIATTYNGPVTISLAAGATGLAGTETVDAVAGVATFSNLSIATDGTYNLLGSSPGLVTTSPPSIQIVIVGAATQLYIIQQPMPNPVQAGSTFGFLVGADDDEGNPTTIFTGNVSVAIDANPPPGSNPAGVAETVPVIGGEASFSGLTLNKVGVGYTLKVTSGNLLSVITNPITVTNAPADHLAITQGDEPPSSVTAGQTFGLTVTAFDPYGNVDLGYSGQISLSISGGVFTGTTMAYAMDGVAMFSGLAIDTAGTFKILATGATTISSPVLASTTSTSIVVSPAAPSQLVWTGQPPPSVIHNYPFGAALDLEDEYGNLETGSDDFVSIVLDHNPTNASLGGDTTANLVDGVASFTDLSISAVGNGYTLQGTASAPGTTSGGITSAASDPIDVTPTPAVSLAITVQPPSNVTVEQTFSFQVTALDQYGDPDGDFNGDVTVALASGPTSQLGGTLTVQASGGIATFSNLTVGTVGSGYTLAVSGTDPVTGAKLIGATSNPFSVNPGPAAKLLVTTEPVSSVAAGTAFGFVVTAEDQYGNLATGFNGNVTISLESGPSGATLTGTTSAAATGGVADVSGLILTKAGTNYTLQVSGQVSGTALTAATTTAITVTPLAASQFVISSQPPSTVTAGSPFGLQITAEDKYGNQATAFHGSVAVSLSHNPGTGVLSGTLISQASSGVAQFSALQLDTAGSPYTIAASNGTLTSPPSTPITVTPSTATTLIVYIPPPTTMTSGSQFGLAIAALDQYGNLATGYTGSVTLALENNPGNATLSGPLTVNAVGGVANFHAFITTEIAASGYTLQATADGLSSVTTGPITVVPAPATHLVIISQPPSVITAGTAFGFIVAAEDAYSNIATPYTGQIVVSAPAGSGATLTGTTSIAATNGEVSFSGLMLSETGGAVGLSVSSTGLTGVTTNPVTVTTPAQVAFATGTVTVNETAGEAAVQVVRSGGYTGAISVHFATATGTAVPGVNYTPVSQTVNFAAGQNSQMVMIPVINTGALPTPVSVTIALSSPGSNTTLGSQSTATLVIQSPNQPPPPPPLVTLESISLVTKKHKVKQIEVDWSGALNASQASSTALYELIVANKSGQFIPKKKNLVKIKSAAYSSDVVTLTLKSPLKLTKSVELIVQGTSPNGLQDAEGRLIDGANNGMAGSNAVATISKTGVTIDAKLPGGPMAAKKATTGK